MCKAMLFLPILGLASSLWAADPIIGTWKLNLEKSTGQSSPAAPIKEQTEVYREIDSDLIELTLTRIGADSSPTSSKLTWPIQGGALKGLLRPGQSLVETFIAAGEWYVTYMQDGKQYLTIHKVISKDGKTMRQTSKGVDAQGKPYERLRLFDRQ